MKMAVRNMLMTTGLLMASLSHQAQQLDVAVMNIGGNVVQITGTATSPGFDAAPNNSWASMNLTWRIPKSAATPSPTVAPPASTPEVTGESTAFTGTSPRDAFTGSTDLAIFDLTTFGQPDDGYWYFQVTGTTEDVQNISTGNSIVLYEFTLPVTWICSGCVELLTTDVPGIPISTTSFIDNAGTGADVLNISTNNAPLPVAWLYVRAAANNSSILVSWATAMEQHNAGFEVERSEDGRSFMSIAAVPGKGNATTTSYYAVNDWQAEPAVKYYYRIKQTDLDGKVRYSATVNAMIPAANLFAIQVKPNPVKDMLIIEMRSPQKQQVQVVITDVTGRVYRQDVRVNTDAGTTKYVSNVAHYPAGTYIVKVITLDGAVQAAKFIIE